MLLDEGVESRNVSLSFVLIGAQCGLCGFVTHFFFVVVVVEKLFLSPILDTPSPSCPAKNKQPNNRFSAHQP